MQKDLKIRISIDKKTGELKVVNGEFNKLEKSVKSANTSTNTLNTSLMNLAKGAVGIYAINQAFSAVVKSGFAFNSQMEQAKAGLTSLAVAVQDKSIPVMERYRKANLEASDTLVRLQKINAQTPHTLDQTNQIYKAMYVSMKNAGASTSDMVEMTRSLSIASGAAGIEFNSLLAGVDGLATGTVLANSDLGRFLSSLGLTNEALKKSDDVVALVTNKMKDFKAAGTMAESMSNLQNAWDSLAGELTKNIFESSKKDINTLSHEMESLTHWAHEYNIQLRDTRDIKYHGTIDDIKVKLKGLNDELRDLNRGDWIGANALKSAQQITAERIQLEHDISTLKKKLLKEEEKKEKDKAVEIAEFTKKKTALADEKRVKKLQDNAKLVLKNISNETQAEFDAISAKWDYEEQLEIQNQENKKAFADWYYDYIGELGDEQSNKLADTLNETVQNTFKAGSYEFSDLGEAFGDSLTKAGGSAVSTVANQYATIMSGGNQLAGSIAGGLGGMLAGGAISFLVDSIFSSKPVRDLEKESEDAFQSFIENMDKATKRLDALGNTGTSNATTFATLDADIATEYSKMTDTMVSAIARVSSDNGISADEQRGKQKALGIYVDGKEYLTSIELRSMLGVINPNVSGYDTFNATHSVNDLANDVEVYEKTIAKLEKERQDKQIEYLGSELDFSKKTYAQLQDITSSLDYKDFERVKNAVNDAAIATKNGTDLTERMTNALAEAYDPDGNFAKVEDFADAFKQMETIVEDFKTSIEDMAESISKATLKYMQPKSVGFDGLDLSGATMDNYNDYISKIDSSYEYEKTLMTDKYNTEKDILNQQLTSVQNLVEFSNSLVYDNQTEQVRLRSSGKLLENSITEFNRLLSAGKDTALAMSAIQNYTKDYVKFLQATSATDSDYNYSLAVLQNKLKKTSVADMTTDELATAIENKLTLLDSTFENGVDFLGIMATDKLVALQDGLMALSQPTLDLLDITGDVGELTIAGLDNVNLGVLGQTEALTKLLGDDSSVVKAVNAITTGTATQTKEFTDKSVEALSGISDSVNDIVAPAQTDYSSFFTSISIAYGEFKGAIDEMPTNESSFDYVSTKFGAITLDVEYLTNATNLAIGGQNGKSLSDMYSLSEDMTEDLLDKLADNISAVDFSAMSISEAIGVETITLSSVITSTAKSIISAINNPDYAGGNSQFSPMSQGVSKTIDQFYIDNFGRTADTSGRKYFEKEYNRQVTDVTSQNRFFNDMAKAGIQEHGYVAPAVRVNVDFAEVLKELKEVKAELHYIKSNTANTANNTKTSRIA